MEPWIWAIIIAGFLIIEFVSYEMVSVWLAAGSVGGLVLSFIPGVPWWVQVLVSIALALIFLAFTRKIVMKWLASKETKTNVDAMEGKEARLLTGITIEECGTVKVADVIWNVRCAKPNEQIKQGTLVKIIKVDGNKLIVEALEEQITENREQKTDKVVKTTETNKTTKAKTSSVEPKIKTTKSTNKTTKEKTTKKKTGGKKK